MFASPQSGGLETSATNTLDHLAHWRTLTSHPSQRLEITRTRCNRGDSEVGFPWPNLGESFRLRLTQC